MLKWFTVVLLIASALNLALMVPGGFVETRIFTQYPVWIIACFNAFLSILGFGSLILAFRVWRSGRVGALSVVCGISFAAVYVLDLLELFPISENPMSPLLFSLEWLGTLLGLSLAIVAWYARLQSQSVSGESMQLSSAMRVGLAVVIVGIVLFSTLSAIG